MDEYTLEEWIGKLPDGHKATHEYARILALTTPVLCSERQPDEPGGYLGHWLGLIGNEWDRMTWDGEVWETTGPVEKKPVTHWLPLPHRIRPSWSASPR